MALPDTPAIAAEAGQTCRTSHNLVGACFMVHGRLFNGPMGVRIAWEETGLVLAVLNRQSAQGADAIPASVRALLPPGSSGSVEGDYVVCPFDRTRLGRIQAVCIDAASRLVAKK